MSKVEEWKTKRKKSLIAICTLGLSVAPWGIIFNSSEEADKGMSFEGGVFGFIFRCIWFLAWTILTSLVMWVINIFKFINYSISISMHENKT